MLNLVFSFCFRAAPATCGTLTPNLRKSQFLTPLAGPPTASSSQQASRKPQRPSWASPTHHLWTLSSEQSGHGCKGILCGVQMFWVSFLVELPAAGTSFENLHIPGSLHTLAILLARCLLEAFWRAHLLSELVGFSFSIFSKWCYLWKEHPRAALRQIYSGFGRRRCFSEKDLKLCLGPDKDAYWNVPFLMRSC